MPSSTFPTRVSEKWIFQDEVTFAAPVGLPPACVGNSQIDPGSMIETDKTEQRYSIRYDIDPATVVANATRLIHLALSQGEVVALGVRAATAPVGGDKQYTVDIQKSADGLNSWTSVLGSPLVFANGDANHTMKTGAINGSVSSLNEGDALRIVVTASGTTGTQGSGLVAEIYCDHRPF